MTQNLKTTSGQPWAGVIPKAQKQVVHMASLIGRAHAASKLASRLNEQVRQFTGRWLCSQHGVCADGCESVDLQVTLASYLAVFPSPAVPTLKTWESTDRGTMQYFSYPAQYLGKHQKIHIWIHAETESVVIAPPKEKPVEIVEAKETEVA